MMKQLMGLVGLGGRSAFLGLFGRKRHMSFMPVLPVGGVVPVAAYLAWRNRDQIRSLFHRLTHRHETASAAA